MAAHRAKKSATSRRGSAFIRQVQAGWVRAGLVLAEGQGPWTLVLIGTPRGSPHTYSVRAYAVDPVGGNVTILHMDGAPKILQFSAHEIWSLLPEGEVHASTGLHDGTQYAPEVRGAAAARAAFANRAPTDTWSVEWRDNMGTWQRPGSERDTTFFTKREAERAVSALRALPEWRQVEFRVGKVRPR